MENKRISKRGKLGPFVLFLAVVSFVSVMPSFANQQWKQEFVGNINFELNEDPELSRLNKRTLQARRRLEDANALVTPQQEKVNGLKKKKSTLKGRRVKLVSANSTDEQRKVKITQEIETISAQLKTLTTRLPKVQERVRTTKAQFQKENQKLKNLQNRLQKVKTECAATPKPNCKQRINALNTKIAQQQQIVANQKSALTKAQNTLKGVQKKIAQNEAKISKKTAAFQAIDRSINDRNQRIATIDTKIVTVNKQLKRERAALKSLQEQVRVAQNRLQKFRQSRKQHRRELIAKVLEYNRRGVRFGRDDGADDGYSLAVERGQDYGNSDGEDDGHIAGTRAGKQRDYDRGYNIGLEIGAQRAEKEGFENGKRDGTIQGNIIAAKRIGAQDGTTRANNSDAFVVGENQGIRAGKERAIVTGKRVGTARGEAQAIEQYESVSLKEATIAGPFAAVFSKDSPDFPAGFEGREYDPYSGPGYGSKIVNKAYVAGYIAAYRRTIRSEYYSSIDEVYGDAYDSAHSYAYEAAYSRDYPGEFDRGEFEGTEYAYNRDYPRRYEESRIAFRDTFSQDPNVNSTEYKKTYAQVEEATYQRVYEEIRVASYNVAEQATFDSNIEEQTEKYRAIRFAAVEGVYVNNPVLKFVKSTIIDGGINGVAAKDGVFQPGENIYHSIVLTNYGLKAAKKVRVALKNGGTFNVPSIAPQSTITVKGAAKSAIGNNGINYSAKKVLTVNSPLTAEKKIQGKFYHDPANGFLNSGDTKTVTVKYPLKLTGLRSLGTIVLGQTMPLKITVVNESIRNYKGGLEIDVTVNSATSIISKGFNPIASLGKSKTVKDAKVLIKDERDAYTPLVFNAKISKNGVLLGNLDITFKTIAKAAYNELASAPVLIANYDQAPTDFMDIVTDLGGLTRASVIDTSVAENAQIVSSLSLKGKTAIIITTGAMSAIGRMIQNAKNSVFIKVDETRNQLRDLMQLGAFANAVSLKLKVSNVGEEVPFAFTYVAPRFVTQQKASVAIQSDMNNYAKLFRVADFLKLSNDALLKRITSKVNSSNFFDAGVVRQLLQMTTLRCIDEVTKLNTAHVITQLSKAPIKPLRGTSGIYMHQKIMSAVKGGVNSGNVSLFMYAHDFDKSIRNAIKKYRPISGIIKLNTENYFMESINKRSSFFGSTLLGKASKKLKKYQKSLYKAVDRKKGMVAPFELSNGSSWDEDGAFL